MFDFYTEKTYSRTEVISAQSPVRVAVGAANFCDVALAGFPFTGIDFLMSPAHNQLNGLHFAGIVTLNGAGETQLDAVNAGFTHLIK